LAAGASASAPAPCWRRAEHAGYRSVLAQRRQPAPGAGRPPLPLCA